MKQAGLIGKIIEALGLDKAIVHVKGTPAEASPMVKDNNGDKAPGIFSFTSMIGMLL